MTAFYRADGAAVEETESGGGDAEALRQWEEYIRDQRARGVAPAALRADLVSRGWAESDVDGVLSRVDPAMMYGGAGPLYAEQAHAGQTYPGQTYPGQTYPGQLYAGQAYGDRPALLGQTSADAARQAAKAAAQRHMLYGALWCIGGIAVTAITYSAASSSPGGGRYVVAWGAIIFGAIQFFRGVAGMGSD